MKSHESDTMSNRIVHISVQLFSNEELARHVTEECQLLDIMVTVLLYMMESCLIKSELQGKLSQYVSLYAIQVVCVMLSLDHCTTSHGTSVRFSDMVFQKRLLNLQNQHSFIWLCAV